MVLTVMYLFKRAEKVGEISPQKSAPQAVLDFEAQVRDGLGQNGKPVTLKEQTDEDMKEQLKNHRYEFFFLL